MTLVWKRRIVKVNLQWIKIRVRQKWLMRSFRFPANVAFPLFLPVPKQATHSKGYSREPPLHTVSSDCKLLFSFPFSSPSLSFSCSSQHVIQWQPWNLYQVMFHSLWVISSSRRQVISMAKISWEKVKVIWLSRTSFHLVIIWHYPSYTVDGKVKRLCFRITPLGFKYWILHLLATWHQTSYLTSVPQLT